MADPAASHVLGCPRGRDFSVQTVEYQTSDLRWSTKPMTPMTYRMPSNRLGRLSVAIGFAAALVVPPASGQIFPETNEQAESFDRGFDPRKVYDSGDIDTINPMNGQLSLVIPIGRQYPVNGNLSFGFTLVFSSQPTDKHYVCRSDNVDCADPQKRGTMAWPSRIFNSGLGWQLSQGRLFQPEPEGSPPVPRFFEWEVPRIQDRDRWVFISPDGGRHTFYSSHVGGADDPPSPNSFPKFTRDSSYLRLVERQVDPSVANS